MPELPDLQVFSRNLNSILKSKKVKKISVPVSKKLNVSTASLKKKIQGESIKKIYRDGKELYIQFGSGDILSLHLMLHGNLHIGKAGIKEKHAVIGLEFQDHTVLTMSDWQGMATPMLNPEKKTAPDALSKKITFVFLKDQLSGKATIKNSLLDQHILRGIGNAYADEILWHARISPFSIGNKIPDKAIKDLIKSIGAVLRNAEKQILRIDRHRITGEARDFLSIHHAKKKESPTGALIKVGTSGGRKTYYTGEQTLYT